MDKKIYFKPFAITCTVIAILSALVRIFLTFNYTDPITGLFKRGNVLPYIYSYIIAAVVLIIAVGGYIIQKRTEDDEFCISNKLYFIPSFPGVAIIAASMLSLISKDIYGKLTPTSPSILSILMCIFGLFSCLYYFCIVCGKTSGNAFSIFSLTPAAWAITALLILYFDMEILITSPNRVFSQFAYMSFIYFAYAEAKALLKKNNKIEYIASASIALILLTTSSVPNIVGTSILASGKADKIYFYIAQLACAIYTAARLLTNSKSDK